jgi:hypothetical protein
VELEALVLRVYILDVRVAAVRLGGVELGLRMCVLVGTGRGERGFEREGRRLTATGASIMMINDAESVSISTSQVLRSPFYLGRTRAQIDTKTTLLQGSRASNILPLPPPPRTTPFLSCPIPSSSSCQSTSQAPPVSRSLLAPISPRSHPNLGNLAPWRQSRTSVAGGDVRIGRAPLWVCGDTVCGRSERKELLVGSSRCYSSRYHSRWQLPYQVRIYCSRSMANDSGSS